MHYIAIAKVGAPYGLAGWFTIAKYKNTLGQIKQYSIWYLTHDFISFSPVNVEEKRDHKKGYIAKLAFFDSRTAVERLTNQIITITRSQLPILKKGEYYWDDLVGLTVINQNHKVLGRVAHLMATGSNDVLVLDCTPFLALPYLVGTVIKTVNLNQKIIQVYWEC